MSEFVVKHVKNGFVVIDVDLNEEFIFVRMHQVLKFLKERFTLEAS
jgi:ribosomal protein L31E